jgi:hypothetical protein
MYLSCSRLFFHPVIPCSQPPRQVVVDAGRGDPILTTNAVTHAVESAANPRIKRTFLAIPQRVGPGVVT